MDELKLALKKVLATNFSFYLKSHFYHWNVKGPDFYQYHEFLSKIYEDLFSNVDLIAEQIRALDELAPGSLKRYSELTSIQDAESAPGALSMFETLLTDNDTFMRDIMSAYNLAEQNNQIGLTNFLQDLYDKQKKLAWMIRSTIARV